MFFYEGVLICMYKKQQNHHQADTTIKKIGNKKAIQ